MIRYTGNPYVDAGVAVLEYRLRKPSESFHDNDLATQAQELKKEYSKKIWKGYLTIHFPNSAWVQPRIRPEKKRAFVKKVLESYRAPSLVAERGCAFCGCPANALVDRSHIPLLTGETIMVAGASGEPGLPVCGYCLFAVQFYPLATLKVQGRPLFWWTPEPEWTRRLTRRFYQNMQEVLAGSSDKFGTLPWPSTQLLRAAHNVVDDIEDDIRTQKLPSDKRPPLCDIVGIHATNYGSGPDYDELRIPRGLLEFWGEAGNFGPLYRQIEQEAWETDDKKNKKAGKGKRAGAKKTRTAVPVAELGRRNFLYEALGKAFRSPDFRQEAKRVAARFFLRRKEKSVAPNTTVLAEFFLEKVAGMEKARLEAIRDMADSIADHLVLTNRDRRVVWQLFMRRFRLGEFLQRLSRIQRKLSEAGHPFRWEKVLLAVGLTNDEDRTASDHWLVQELILIRLYERLAESEVLGELPEVEEEQTVPEITQ